MPFKTEHTSSFGKDIADFNKSGKPKDKLKAAIDEIISKPIPAESFGVNGVFKYKLRLGNQYRIIYRVYQCCMVANEPPAECLSSDKETMIGPDETCEGLVQFLYLKTREETDNYYKQKKGNLDHSLLDGFGLMTL